MHFLSHYFCGSGVLTWLNWVFNSEFYKVKVKVLAERHSFLELGDHSQAHVVVSTVQFLVILGLKPSAPRGHAAFPCHMALSIGSS